jgi:hypothetical protein
MALNSEKNSYKSVYEDRKNHNESVVNSYKNLPKRLLFEFLRSN